MSVIILEPNKELVINFPGIYDLMVYKLYTNKFGLTLQKMKIRAVKCVKFMFRAIGAWRTIA